MKRTMMALALWAACPTAAWAHKNSDSYLRVAVDGAALSARWDLSVRDVDFALGLDADGDGRVTWGEARAARPRVEAWALGALEVTGDGARCPLAARSLEVVEHTDGAYLALALEGACADAPRALELTYSLLFELDQQHRGLARVEAGGAVSTHVFRPDARVLRVTSAGTGASPLATVAAFVREGVWHVWIGLDHVLFLLALLLPAVLRRDGRAWAAAPALRPALLDVLRVVTAFTAAHSITLTLATLGVVALPSRWVEAGIALSVMVAAVNNVRPFFPFHRWVVAFVLGLLHGFGFSGVLADLGLPEAHLAPALLGFNGGVELGQLAIVAAFVPVAFASRGSWFYRRVVVLGGSVAIALLALVWSVERALVVSIL